MEKKGLEKETEKSRIAASVMNNCRNQLFFTYRYLEQALFRLKGRETEKIEIGCDGRYLYYREDYVLNKYLQESSVLAADYLHTVIHCLYLHPFFGGTGRREYRNLAADLAAESIRMEIMGSGKTRAEQDRAAECKAVIEAAEGEISLLSVQNLCTWLEKQYGSGNGVLGKSLSELERMFARDDHSFWYREESKNNHPDKLQHDWKETAEKVMFTIQGFGMQKSGCCKGKGEQAGNLLRSLQTITREKHDYSEFLRKFARPEERIQTNDEEFDYIYYTYGFRVLDRIPLIEPLEYKEAYLIREFVIAVDTSGSCEGELVERFLTKTYNILKQTECFGSKVNIHIIQCDARIQEDKRIESAAELEDYIAGLTLKGFGGTDFRPVFRYVEELKNAGELRRMGGLVYFTDGYGMFPGIPPKYKTVFAFVKRDDDVRVPPWAMKIYLDEEGLR